MLLWAVLSIAILAGTITGLVFLIRNLRQFQWIDRLIQKNKKTGWLISSLLILVPLILCGIFLGYMNAIIIVLHLIVFLLAARLILYIIQRQRKKKFKHHYTFGIAILMTAAYLAVGWMQAFHVWQTNYTIKTNKKVGSLKIAMFADSHVGTTFDGKGLEQHLARIQDQNPDILVIVGDFVDEDTTKQDMIDACKALKNVHTKYGVYYVFGNHDKGKYSNGQRGYTGDDLANELKKNGVVVLQDENKLIDHHFYLVGRQDASEELDFGGSRKSVNQLTKNLDKQKYSIVLDHQPREYRKDARSGVDLVLSGHTHGGQMIPFMQISKWFHVGGNDNVYGYQRKNDTNYIVTSGISDWAIKFKTGCKSEYVIIDIQGK